MTDMMERTGQVMHDGVPCPAPVHDTQRAWSAGCLSERAGAAWKRRSQRHAASKRASRERVKAAGVTDPRAKWRDGTRKTKVNAMNLLLLTSGFIDSPTEHEIRAAVVRLSQRGHRSGTRVLDNADIAERIGVGPEKVAAVRKKVAELRTRRAERRLADVQWKAGRVRRREAAQAGDLLRHRGHPPSAILHDRARRTVFCGACGETIPAGTLHRLEVRGDKRLRVCDGCALRPRGCAVCGIVQHLHQHHAGFVTPSAAVRRRRVRYRSHLRMGALRESERVIWDIWWNAS